jgi:hypothetical protein
MVNSQGVAGRGTVRVAASLAAVTFFGLATIGYFFPVGWVVIYCSLFFQSGFFVRYSWFRAAGICQANCCNVVFVGTVVCLAVGCTTETVSVVGLEGKIIDSTPATVFACT